MPFAVSGTNNLRGRYHALTPTVACLDYCSLVCCINADSEGGILFFASPFLVKRSFLAAFSLKDLFVMSYIRITNRSKSCIRFETLSSDRGILMNISNMGKI